MILYATTEEFQSKVGVQETVELTNLDDPAANTVNLTRLTDVLTDASREIDSYLATRYKVPLASVPGVLKVYCIDIAWYRLAQNNAPEQYATRYNNAIARLKDLQKGIMVLLDDNGVPIPRRETTTELVDERGNAVDDWSIDYQPGGIPTFTPGFLDQRSVYRY